MHNEETPIPKKQSTNSIQKRITSSIFKIKRIPRIVKIMLILILISIIIYIPINKLQTTEQKPPWEDAEIKVQYVLTSPPYNGDLVYILAISKKCYNLNELIKIELYLANLGDKPHIIYTPYDWWRITIKFIREDGFNKTFIGPNELYECAITWHKIPPHDYLLLTKPRHPNLIWPGVIAGITIPPGNYTIILETSHCRPEKEVIGCPPWTYEIITIRANITILSFTESSFCNS